MSTTPILDRLQMDQIFSIEKISHNEFKIWECCDNYFASILTRDELLALSQEIISLTEKTPSHRHGSPRTERGESTGPKPSVAASRPHKEVKDG